MNLKSFLSTLSPAQRRDFAKRAGTKPIYLSQIIGGSRKPSPALARKLHTCSGHRISLHSLRPDVWDREQERERVA